MILNEFIKKQDGGNQTYYLFPINKDKRALCLVAGYMDLIKGVYSALLNTCDVVDCICNNGTMFLFVDDKGSLEATKECIKESWMVV